MAADMVDVGVVSQAVEPGQERSALPSIPLDGLPGLQEHLLGEIFGFWMAGRAEVQVTNGYLLVKVQGVAKEALHLNEREFAHLLFHGFDERARHHFGKRPDASFLRVLFPEQDFVIWQSDAF